MCHAACKAVFQNHWQSVVHTADVFLFLFLNGIPCVFWAIYRYRENLSLTAPYFGDAGGQNHRRTQKWPQTPSGYMGIGPFKLIFTVQWRVFSWRAKQQPILPSTSTPSTLELKMTTTYAPRRNNIQPTEQWRGPEHTHVIHTLIGWAFCNHVGSLCIAMQYMHTTGHLHTALRVCRCCCCCCCTSCLHMNSLTHRYNAVRCVGRPQSQKVTFGNSC